MSKETACLIEKCCIGSCARCHCCNKDLCMDHLREHVDKLQAKLLPMVDELNSLLNQLEQPLSDEAVHLQTLEQWKIEAHRRVDSYCDEKREYILHGFRKQYAERLDKTRTILNQMTHRQGLNRDNLDRVQTDLELNKKYIGDMEHLQCIASPLYIRDDQFMFTSNTAAKSTIKKNQEKQNDRFHRVRSGRVEKPSSNDTCRSNTTTKWSHQNIEDIPSSMASFSTHSNHSQSLPSHTNKTISNLQIFVQSRMGDRLTLLIRSSDSVRSVKMQIFRRMSIPIENQKMTYLDKELQDNEPMSNYDIHSSATLNLTWKR